LRFPNDFHHDLYLTTPNNRQNDEELCKGALYPSVKVMLSRLCARRAEHAACRDLVGNLFLLTNGVCGLLNYVLQKNAYQVKERVPQEDQSLTPGKEAGSL
jgi:hypothetical protein